MLFEGSTTARFRQRFTQNLAVLGLGRTAVFSGPPTQAGHDVVVKVADNQLRHAINDSTWANPQLTVRAREAITRS